MFRRRDRGLRNGMELLSPRVIPPRVAPTALMTIVRTFEQIDSIMLDEMQADIERRMEPSNESTQGRFSTSPFYDTQAHSENYIQDIKRRISHTSSEIAVFAYLADSRCVTAWSWVCNAVVKFQGDSNNCFHVQWAQAKAQANEILNLASRVVEEYDSDECQNLLSSLEEVGAGIEAKLTTLLSFDSIYSRQTIEDIKIHHYPPHHELYLILIDRNREIKAKRKERYTRSRQIVSNHVALHSSLMP